MAPRPFPFPFRVGTDICSIGRIRKLIGVNTTSNTSPLDRFLAKLLTWPERQYFWARFREDVQRSRPLSEQSGPIAQYLAGRWAAKEACRKACEHLGSSNGFHSIMILSNESSSRVSNEGTSRPKGLILPSRLPELTSELPQDHNAAQHTVFDIASVDGQFCEVSISHDADWATAVAIVPIVEEWSPDSRTQKQEEG